MPTPVPIEIFNIAKTVVDKEEVARWMEFIGANEFELPPDGGISNPALLIALAGKRCYMSFQKSLNPNLSRIRKEYDAYFDNILNSGHGSVLEHSVFSFAFENVSRVFTAEMNRHRAGWAISEGSLRFIRFGQNIPYWLPTSIDGPDVTDVLADLEAGHYDAEGGFDFDGLAGVIANRDDEISLEERKHWSRVVFHNAFANQEAAYRALESIWDMQEGDHNFGYKKKVTSMMRRIVGLGVATGGVWSGNARALRHVITMRASKAAEEEMLHVFSRVAKRMRDQEPLLFGDFKQTEEGFWVPEHVKV